MSPDEAFATMAGLAIAVTAWGKWFFTVITRAPFGAGPGIRTVLALTPIGCAMALFAVLKLFAASDVRNDPGYLAMYEVMGVAWMGLCQPMIALLGVHTRDDALERRNPAAAAVISGGLIAFMLCFAGGNIGDGPGWWVVIFCSILATGSLLGLWWTVQSATGLADAITIERNLSDGLRFAGWLIACGGILGRSVAGDWVSAAETAKDLVASGWPVLVLTLVEMLVGMMRNSDRAATLRGNPVTGLAIGITYVAVATGYILYLGWWT